MPQRVTVGILASHHKQLTELGTLTGHKVTSLVDRAIELLLEQEAPAWRRTAMELKKKRTSTR